MSTPFTDRHIGTDAGAQAQTLAALTPVRHLLTDENRRVLDAFTALHHGEMADRLVAMARGGFRRQGPVSQAALWLAAALGRL